jgi:serine/threonine protein kinase
MTQETNILPIGHLLEEYVIEAVLGAGGFGVTYQARDTHLNTRVAIKEYFPLDWSYRGPDGISVHPNTQGRQVKAETNSADYQWGLERFLDEAQALAAIKHPYVVCIHRYFRANGTAYIVMEYEEGLPLSAVLASQETLPEAELQQILHTVLPALCTVHERGYLHRDIKPGNLYLRTRDQCMMLIDFGAAREMLGRHSTSITSMVTPGYSPPEQYVVRQNYAYGPWTDIYALGAVLYRCISGATPLDAAERLLGEPLQPAMTAGAGRYSPELLAVVDRALALLPEERYQSVAEMESALHRHARPSAAVDAATETDGNAPTLKLNAPLSLKSTTAKATPVIPNRWVWRAAVLGLLLTAGFSWYSLTTTEDNEELKPPRYRFYQQLKAENQPTPAALELIAGDPGEDTFIENIGEAAQAPDDSPASENPAEPDATESALPAGEVDEIPRLLTAAQDSLTAYRLTTPPNQSAFHYYRRVLALDPDNLEAQQGLAQVAANYVQLTRRAVRQSDYGKAGRYVKAGLSVDPDHPELLALQAQIRAAPPPPARPRSAGRSILSGDGRGPSRPVGFNDK